MHLNHHMMRTIFCVAYLFAGLMATAQPDMPLMTREEYIERYKDDAIKEMHTSGVPASITLAQGLLESANGNSPLARYANNHFGIKCHGWNGSTFYQDDDEKNECFRKYYSVLESYHDHSEFLRTRPRYGSLFQLKTTDYKGWATGLRKAGYATNPKYAHLLIRIIEENHLYQYDEADAITPLVFVSNDVKPAGTLRKREILIHDNDIKYVIARKGDSYFSIARAYGMHLWQIKKYNDINPCDEISEGDIIYLQPKRGKARIDEYTVKAGETMRSISQKFGIKLSVLYKKNAMTPGTEPRTGQVLQLRRKVKPQTSGRRVHQGRQPSA